MAERFDETRALDRLLRDTTHRVGRFDTDHVEQRRDDVAAMGELVAEGTLVVDPCRPRDHETARFCGDA